MSPSFRVVGAPKWDKYLLQNELAHRRLADGGHRWGRPDGKGEVLVVPVGTAADDWRLERLQAEIDPLDWAVVLATSDECSTFDWKGLKHPNMRLWIQTPRPELHFQHDRFLPHGTPPGVRSYAAGRGEPTHGAYPWMFAGQVNHHRREQLMGALEGVMKGLPGLLLPSGGFMQGLDREEYLARLAATKIALAPPGPCTPDSFRLYEALELGCVPIVDAICPAFIQGYWHLVFGEVPPFPIAESWVNVVDLIDHNLSLWPVNATRCSAWWQGYKHRLHWRINDDVSEVSGVEAPTGEVTVLIPTSPIKAHPSTEMIEETVASVRFHLPDAQIIIMCDGVRPQQEERRTAYEAYLNRLMWLCEHRFGHCVPLVFDEHAHQIRMTAKALELVRSPTILFVEHDTPLVTDEAIDWENIFRLVSTGDVNVLRFHYEALVLEVHEHLMLDHQDIEIDRVPLRRTIQYSQRPHVANTAYYRRLIDRVNDRRGMIEDAVCGYVETEPWGAHRVAIYCPPGRAGIKRSLNLDGRGDDYKWVIDL